MSDEDRAKLAELDEALARFEQQKRWSDFIRTLVAKADLVTDPQEKLDLLSRAGREYIERSANQAEAIKCFEAVLEIDGNHPDALARLKDLYEKRRDWERLVRIRQREAEALDGAEQLAHHLETARMATERVRKPELCIELWKRVLDFDPDVPEAIGALVGLYERAREWAPLATVLERWTEQIAEPNELKTQLQKLGMLYADKINDDEGAVRVFK